MNPNEPGAQGPASPAAPQPYYASNYNINMYPARVKTVEPKHFESTDSIFAAAMLLCGFLAIHMEVFFFGAKGFGVTFATAVFMGICWVYMKKSGFSQTRESLLYVGLLGVTASRFTLLHGSWIDFFGILLLVVLAVYWIAVTTDRRLGGDISAASAGDLPNQMICVPFSNFSCCFAGLGSGLSKTKKGKGVMGALIGLIIFLPVLVIVTGLLVSADAAFEQWTIRFADAFFGNFFIYVLEFLFGIPVACYLFGLLYGNIKGRYTGRITEKSVLQAAKAFHIAPASAVYTSLGALAAIYMVFFAAQASYLFSAFENHLPEAMTYAEYARRGFFELCQVAAINLAVITGAFLLLKRPERSAVKGAVSGAEENAGTTDAGNNVGTGINIGMENAAGTVETNGVGTAKEADDTLAAEGSLPTGTPKLLRGFTVLISAQTLLLLVTAVSKMVMYIDSYGLTPLRVYTTWFMGLLFILFCLLILNQFKPFKLAKAAVLLTVVAFLALSYANVDSQIARYNIGRYEAGTLNNLDIWGDTGLANLTDGTVPYLVELYQSTEDEALKENLEIALGRYRLRQIYRNIHAGDMKTWNLQSARAYRLLEEVLPASADSDDVR